MSFFDLFSTFLLIQNPKNFLKRALRARVKVLGEDGEKRGAFFDLVPVNLATSELFRFC